MKGSPMLLQQDSLAEPDIADRASLETDRSLELRTRDRDGSSAPNATISGEQPAAGAETSVPSGTRIPPVSASGN
ncbi:MAG: hypothetical protein ACLQME_09725 [Alphaproteobacteria bacterium]